MKRQAIAVQIVKQKASAKLFFVQEKEASAQHHRRVLGWLGASSGVVIHLTRARLNMTVT